MAENRQPEVITRKPYYTVHTYNESLAEYVYTRLPACVARFREALAATA